MKRWMSFLIVGGVVILLIIMIVMGGRGGKRTFDSRVTLSEQDKIPYGTKVAYDLLPTMFRNAVMQSESRSPGSWKALHAYDTRKAVIFFSRDRFQADQDEMEALIDFARGGNYVLIAAHQLSFDAETTLGLRLQQEDMLDDIFNVHDSMSFALDQRIFGDNTTFTYPGMRYQSTVVGYDTSTTTVLSRTSMGGVVYVKLSVGTGAIFVHTSPLAFSNYFILHKKNIRYFESAMSVIPPDVDKIVWNNYYLNERKPKTKPRSVIGILMRYKAFRYALPLLFFLLLLYLLFELRRKQRMIPRFEKPSNASLDFVKTMGRLYFERGDHANLARKMANFFLEHVRNRYKLGTIYLDSDFVEALHRKSGYAAGKIERIATMINRTNQNEKISQQQLIDFYQQLEDFYQTT